MKKTNIFKTLLIGGALCFAQFTANAQFEFGLSLDGGIVTGDMAQKVPITTNPLYDGGSAYGNSQGLLGRQYVLNGSSAILGFAFRFGYRIPINNSEYGEVLPYVEINGMWNRPNKNIRNQYNTYGTDGNAFSNYINIPLYVGAQYRYPVTDIIKPYVEFGIGYNMLLITTEKGDKSAVLGYPKGLDTYKYKNPMGSISGNVGVGCFFSDYVSVGVYYYGLGSSIAVNFDSDSKVTDTWEVTNNHAATRTYGTVAFRLNFHFGPRD